MCKGYGCAAASLFDDRSSVEHGLCVRRGALERHITRVEAFAGIRRLPSIAETSSLPRRTTFCSSLRDSTRAKRTYRGYSCLALTLVVTLKVRAAFRIIRSSPLPVLMPTEATVIEEVINDPGGFRVTLRRQVFTQGGTGFLVVSHLVAASYLLLAHLED